MIGVCKLKKRILLVEEDEGDAKKLTQAITQQGFEVTYLTTPIKAVAEFTKKNYDLVISNDSLKEMDGVRLLAILKEINPNIHSILLTIAPDEVGVEAIDGSIDHYLSKERDINILLTCIHSLLKKEVQTTAATCRLSSSTEQITVDLENRVVIKENHRVSLTAKEYELLVLFLNNKGIALSSEEIAKELWSDEFETIDMRVIDGHIKRLRTTLSLFSISSVRGYGYKWSEK